MAPFKLGNKTFPSKAAAKKFVSNYLQTSPSGTVPTVEDMIWIMDLLSRHPAYESHFKNSKGVIVYKEETYNNYNAFHFIREDGTMEAISYLKALETDKTNNVSFFRREIEYQIRDFKNKVFTRNEVLQCELCSCNIVNDRHCHIDHLNFFTDLVNEFATSKNINLNDRNIYAQCKALTYQWQRFHFENAILRPICDKCNLKRKPLTK